VATIALNRPEKRNAQSPETWLWLTRTINALPGTVRVLLVRGEGPAFSAGLDLSQASSLVELASRPGDEALAAIQSYQEAFGLAARPGLVSVALVQGFAIGAGFQLALGCDIRIVAEDAQFSMAEVTLGLVPDLGGTKRLVELVGYSRAASLCLTGRRISAVEADRIGLVSELVPAGELDAAGDRFVSQILQLQRDAVIEVKALLLTAAGNTQSEQESAEREAQYRRLRALAGLDAEA
jgi:enoyl-CoA hydratase/carnithine racemase